MQPLMLWDRAWHGPTSAARPTLLARALLLVFAFDSAVLMAAHAARYGDSGFNVAHFGILDAFGPFPTPALYLGVLLLAGGIAFYQALAGPSRLGMALALLLQGYAWMMSRLDSYQHHYLLSLLLLCLSVSFRPRAQGESGRIDAWGFRLAGATLSLVYLFASIAKLEPGWAGAFLGHRRALVEFIHSLGFAVPERAMALGVGSGEIFVGLSYALAALYPEPRPTWLKRLLLVSLAAAFGFHVGVQILGVQIGWFSVYAILAAGAFFLPEEAMDALARGLERIEAQVQSLLARVPVPAAAALGAACALAAGAFIALPGTLAAGIAGAVAIVLVAMLRRNSLPLWGGVGALLLSLALSVSGVRFDYWRFAGRDALRRGDRAAALEDYRKAEAHAPPGESREARIHELENP